jgi:ubiquinone/menaquinone biosynthesis C-methylase UbiE
VIAGLKLQPSDHVLEMGCGTGNWSDYFTPQVASYTAFDLRYAEVRQALTWEASRSGKKTKFCAMSGTAMGLSSNSFNKAFAVDVIEHIPDENVAMQEMHRVLKPGGTLILTTLLQDRPGFLRRVEYPDHSQEYTTEHLQTLFRRNGFKIERTFYFYYSLSTLAREIETLTQMTISRNLFPIQLGINMLCRPFNDVERLLPLGRPGGIGVVGTVIK